VSRPYDETPLTDGTIKGRIERFAKNDRASDPKDNSFMTWPVPSGGKSCGFVLTSSRCTRFQQVNKAGIVEITKKKNVPAQA
jgi:hypothetical protein